MASKMPLDTRPTSRPPATGADHEVAPPVAGLAALGAAGVALSAAAAWIAATGAGPAPHGFSAVVHALVIAAPIAAGLYAVYVTPARALRLAADPRRGPVVTHDAGRVAGQRALQHRPSLGLVRRAAADLPRARIPIRAVREPRGPAAVQSRVGRCWAVSGVGAPWRLSRRRAPGPAAVPTARPTRSCCRAPSPASWTPCSCR